MYRCGLFLKWSSPEQEGLTRTWIKIIDFHRRETQRIWGSIVFFLLKSEKASIGYSEIREWRNRALLILWMQIPHFIHCLARKNFFCNKKKGRVKRSCCSRTFWRQVRMWMTSQAKLGQVELLQSYKFSTNRYLPQLTCDVCCVFYMTLLKFSTAIGILRSCGVIGIQYVA